MINKQLAVRYSRALLGNVPETEYQHLLQDLDYLNLILMNISDQIKLFDSFLFPFTDKSELISVILSGLKKQLHWKQLFLILLRKHKFSLLSEILSELEKTVLEEQNRIKVTLKLARQQSEESISSIKDYLMKIFEKEISFVIIIEPELIGGFKAETENLTIDGTLANIIKQSMRDV
ncbi:MAG: F0F1 ATP synthase subunit delta [Candidatus Cloacimonetes bacterium]|nr:F0F1 ATP synthase subunit delta [Candidatus Cloacimonadota bacterium]